LSRIKNHKAKSSIPREKPQNRNAMTKIMIVEDNLHARRALKALISQQAGINVTAEAANGQEAICNIRGETPDIVLMDMRMPVMDGLEATKIIKKNWSQIKIIILTMYPDCQKEVLSAGADAFLIKGCSMDEIASTIHSLN
jgi:YesN/AraC family two-component response regulator